MSRIAKSPITVAKGVDVKVDGRNITVKGSKGSMELKLHRTVSVTLDDGVLTVAPANDSAWAMAGTMRALLGNMVHGVSEGFEKRLQLVGVGYRAQGKGKVLSLSLGYSHPIDYPVPDGVTIDTPTQTEVVISGSDKQRVGQVAAEIRAFRPPEPYKGKGVRYVDERIIRKEAKKK
jgi:large subunit ribosomal protein L6